MRQYRIEQKELRKKSKSSKISAMADEVLSDDEQVPAVDEEMKEEQKQDIL